MPLIHANNVPPGKFRRRVHNCQPWLHIVKRRLWTEEEAVIGADKIELILVRLNYQTTAAIWLCPFYWTPICGVLPILTGITGLSAPEFN